MPPSYFSFLLLLSVHSFGTHILVHLAQLSAHGRLLYFYIYFKMATHICDVE